MTLNEAIMKLTMLWNDPTCPEDFKPDLRMVIEKISELEEPCEQVLGESCEIGQYAETCEECGFCDNISRQQAGKAVKEPVKPVYVWASTSLKEIEAVGALVQNVIKQTQDIIVARIEELPVQCDNRPLTINMNLDEEQAKRALEMFKKGGATFVLPEPDKPAAGETVAITDDWLQGDAPEMETVHLGDGTILIRPIETQKETPC